MGFRGEAMVGVKQSADIVYTDFDCRNDQDLKIPYSPPQCDFRFDLFFSFSFPVIFSF